VIRETCSLSTTDVNMLKSVIYNAKFDHIVTSSCAVGEYYCCDNNMLRELLCLV